jgi:hypothetical protein
VSEFAGGVERLAAPRRSLLRSARRKQGSTITPTAPPPADLALEKGEEPILLKNTYKGLARKLDAFFRHHLSGYPHESAYGYRSRRNIRQNA